MPDKKDRKALLGDPALNKKYKQYFKEYQSERAWKDHPFADYSVKVRSTNLFQTLRKKVQTYINTKGFTIFSPKTEKGTVLLTNYMSILQKVASLVQREFMFEYAKDTKYIDSTITGYDLIKDSSNIVKHAKEGHGEEFKYWLEDKKYINDGASIGNLVDRHIRIVAAQPENGKVGVEFVLSNPKWKVMDPAVTNYRANIANALNDVKTRYEKGWGSAYTPTPFAYTSAKIKAEDMYINQFGPSRIRRGEPMS
jgi:hypothetical protein